MRVALRLIALAVGLAAVGAAAAADVSSRASPPLARRPPSEANDYLASAKPVRRVSSIEINAKDRSSSNAIPRVRARPTGAPTTRRSQTAGRQAGSRRRRRRLRPRDHVSQGAWAFRRTRREAAKWLRKSADLGLARAQTSLGAMYAFGEGVPQSRAEAMRWTKAWRPNRATRRAQYVAGSDVLRRPRRSAGSCPGPHVAQSRGRAGPEAGRRGSRPGRGMDRVAGRDRQSAADGGRAQRGGGAAGRRATSRGRDGDQSARLFGRIAPRSIGRAKR